MIALYSSLNTTTFCLFHILVLVLPHPTGNMNTTLVPGVHTAAYARPALDLNSGVVAAVPVEFHESVFLGQ
jgi:hypothetical protein